MTDGARFPNAFLDDLAKLATNAAGLAKGARDEVETLMRARVERWLSERDLVTREEFDAVREMAIRARTEVDELKARLDALERRGSSTDSTG